MLQNQTQEHVIAVKVENLEHVVIEDGSGH